LRELILRLPQWAELIIVELGAFGYFIAISLWYATHPVVASPAASGSDGGIIGLALFEVAVFAVLWSFLLLRGWSLARMGLFLDPIDVLKGFGLALATAVAYELLGVLVALVAPHWLTAVEANANFPKAGFTISTAVAVLIINPIYEEVFVCGYLISALKTKRSAWVAIHASVAVRLLYHLYQGPIAILEIPTFGLIFGWWYARTGRLMPLIAAHGVLDLVALATMMR
jgi:membrane protease YdiL (CAAX protease family)